MKHALDQLRPSSRQALDFIEKLGEDEANDARIDGTFDCQKDRTITFITDKRDSSPDTSESLKTLNVDMWSLLSAKAEGEAEEKLERCNLSERLWAYLRIHLYIYTY